MKNLMVLFVPFLFYTCSIPTLSRSPLDYFAFLRIVSGPQFTGHNIGGAVSGLLPGTSVTLTNVNDSITVSSDGNFSFPTKLSTGQSYNVSLTTNGVGLTCSIANAQGVVQNSHITNVSVTCGIGPGFYEVGVNVSGLSGAISVQNNATETLNFSANGLQKFTTIQPSGTNYAITISSQPVGTVCSFDNPSLSFGTVTTANVTIFITCVTGYIVSGNLYSTTGANLGPNLINRRTAVKTLAGSFPTNTPSGAGAVFGGAVPSATASAARFNSPAMLATDSNFIYVVDSTNSVIRKIDKLTGTTTILAGGNTGGGTTCPGAVTTNCLDGVGTAAQFNGIVGITTNGNNLFVLELTGNRIRIVNLATAAVSTFVGSGGGGASNNTSGILATFTNPSWITIHNGMIYVVDRGNCLIRSVNPVTTAVSTLAGGPGFCSFANHPIGTNARFVSPIGIVGLGSYLYVTDVGLGGGYKIRRIDLTGTNAVDTIAGDGVQASTDGFGTSAQFNDPHGITTDGTNLFISEWLGHRIRHLDISTNKVTTLVGSSPGYADNATGNGLFQFPGFITSDGQKVYISDQANHSIRFLEPAEILHYSFDGSANDSIGTNHGTIIGSPILKSDENGVINGAYEFNGLSDSINSSGLLSQKTDDITFSAWVLSYANNSNQFILYNGLGGVDGYGLKIDSTGSLQIGLGAVDGPSTTMKMPLNRWTHVAVRRLSSNWQIFINGVPDAAVFATNPTQPPLSATFKIGDAGNALFFRGKISRVQFFDGALDNDAIQKLAIQVPSGLISYYPFNGSGKDYGNFLNDLTNNFAVGAADRNGFPNTAYSFNGTNSYFQKLNPNGLPIGVSSRTLCAWFKTPTNIGQYILSFGTAINSTGNGLVVNSPILGMFGWNDDANVIPPHEEFTNQWIHLCGVYDGMSQIADVYENGTLRISLSKSSWLTGVSGSLDIGRLITATGYFSGLIDDVRIYDRPLSVSEIRAISGPYPTQVSSWSQTLASSSLKFFLMPESAIQGPGGCIGGTNCVTYWLDRSGNNFHVSQAGASAQPVYNPTGIGGFPGVRFYETNATYLSASCVPELISTSNTIFAMFNDVGMVGNDGIFHNGKKLLYLTDNGPNNTLSLFDIQINNVKLATTTDYGGVGENILMSLDFNGTTGNIFKNGSVVSSSSIPGTAYDCMTYDMSIGRYVWSSGTYPNNGDYLDGHIGDLIYYDQVLSASDRELVQCYLSSKYKKIVGHPCP
ncbi:Pentraxin-related protein [Leptospira biflexa serovar Patoc strain 'Patoc 1 (Ames)']|uniref:LamG-like jellyroll fold domain-containing protein n=1 Tax=Leptospira biflexa serovar Patoc (strain Patoc 1 / ATCC 23582 / Paris) TaxID=456481 RepID=B0SNA6_LEPBP|nr:LamG-like jellyroll fold domain-containing protein [Leptospira biflexa]ABZ95191.1 Pentraxin-related protein [Leptospira biflexa serovar Patoc strain 'Patoc 1 (Ames)']ABZ98873.1 Hypothetical protein LEPBI_I2796 [Leptospira biflexa serovar Patoc strain 'Patoc 1 (Paris)']